VLAILPYDTVEEAIAIANDTVYGLGAHVQGTDKDRCAPWPASSPARCT
jgi:betaine-aldehyde dehydrogenase